MIEVLSIIASSWPIAAMVIGLAVTFTVRNLIKRDYEAVYEQRARNAVAVRQSGDD